ncbi:hypothetical protein [Methylobacterium planeticum]|uniref:Uncharacterized protein n=1 Tax=Methylobacterium planeticum TaxID=2615211 RepID=A0A6N6ME00_9HYPH|nr:hypothetical protein [Methylobacterium planeticum]KAB1067566.1 hypothetical protein F6X51_27515 [Methylobacterium planeticum]
MPSASTILTSSCISAVVITGLTFLADVSTRAQLDHALENVRASRAPTLTVVETSSRHRPPAILDRKRLEATALMVSQPGEE